MGQYRDIRSSDTSPAMTSRRFLLADVMSTICYDPFHEEIPTFFGMEMDELLDEKDPTAWVEFERGEIDEATFLRRFFEDERPIDSEGLRETVREAYEFVPGMEQLLADLDAAGWEIHAMSNYTTWYELIEGELRLSRFLDWSFVSCKTGVRKPDEAAYRNALEELGARPDECVFVDDRTVNCEAARRVGIEAVCFEGAENLRGRLLG